MEVVLHDTYLHGNFSEFLVEGEADTVAVFAPHGGQAEPNTDIQAILLAQEFDDATVWGTRGLVDGSFGVAFNRWHYTSEDYALDEFPLFARLLNRRFNRTVSFHVMGGEGILVGGQASENTKQTVARHLREQVPVSVDVVGDGPRAGMNPQNFCNAVAEQGGIHLEQSLECACNYPETVVKAVRTALDELDE